MKKLASIACLAALLCVVGCGEKDINKDIKPVGKDAPMPTTAGAASPGAKKDAGPGLKAPTPP